MLQDIDGNGEEIKYIIGVMRVLRQGYVIKDDKVQEIPYFFLLAYKILEFRMKLVIGTASLRNNRIKFRSLQDYFNLVRFLMDEEMAQKTSLFWGKVPTEDESRKINLFITIYNHTQETELKEFQSIVKYRTFDTYCILLE